MRGKSIAIGVLVALACLLGGLVANGLRPERAAYGQGGVYATYLAAAVEVREDFVNFAVLDTEKRLLLFYNMTAPSYEMQPTRGRRLENDFRRKIP